MAHYFARYFINLGFLSNIKGVVKVLRNLRTKLKGNPLIYNSYMRVKRIVTGELLGMTSKNEQDYFAKYGEKLYSGKGEIVDLGCWLGSTTIPLVAGLLKNSAFTSSKRKVFAYDTFVWSDVMKDGVAGTNLVGKFKEGDSFLEEYKIRTKKYTDKIKICDGDLKEIGWNGNKIEFLLVDAMKNWELTSAIVKDFYSSLIPNVSYVLQQDFAHYFTPWIHLLHWHLRDYFDFIEDIPKASSVVYKYVNQIPPEKLNQTYSFDYFSNDDIEKAFEYSISLIKDEKKANIYAAKVMCFIHQNKLDEARNCFQAIFNRGVPIEKDLLVVQNLLFDVQL